MLIRRYWEVWAVWGVEFGVQFECVPFFWSRCIDVDEKELLERSPNKGQPNAVQRTLKGCLGRWP